MRIRACPFTTASQGLCFLLRFESRSRPASHHLGELSQEVRSGSGCLGTEPRSGRDLQLLSPSDTHLAWRRAELHSSHTGTRGPYDKPPSSSCPLPCSCPGREAQATEGQFSNARISYRGLILVLTQSLQLSDTLPMYFCQGDKNMSPLPIPAACEKSQLCAKRCRCVYKCVLGWGIKFQVIYFPIESLPCSHGRTVIPMHKFG